MKKISIIICFNEKENLIDLTNSVKKYLKSDKYEYEHIIADNNSKNRQKILEFSPKIRN